MTRYALIAALSIALGLSAYVTVLVRSNSDLRSEKAAIEANLDVLRTQQALARDADIVAQKERARMAIAAAKYETIRDAFRKGNFDEPLPDDFQHLVACLLRGSAASDHQADCP